MQQKLKESEQKNEKLLEAINELEINIKEINDEKSESEAENKKLKEQSLIESENLEKLHA